MNEFEGKVTGGVYTTDGGGDHWKAQAAINVPLVDDKLAARFVVSKIDNEGFIERPLEGIEDYNDSEDISYRAKVLFTPTDNLSVVASYWSWEHNAALDFANDDYEAINFFQQIDGSLRVATSEWAEAENNTDLYGLTAKFNGESFRITSSTSYVDADSAQTYDNLIVPFSLDFPTIETFAQEFNLASVGEGPLHWTAGAIYLDMETDTTNKISLFADGVEDPVAEIENVAYVAKSESWAVFGEVTYELNDKWEMTLGARYFEDDRDITDRDAGSVAGLPSFGIPLSRSDTFDQFTGRINIAWRPGDSSLYYANIAQGYRSGILNSGFSILGGAGLGVDVPFVADPDEVTSYEVGGKWTALDGALSLETVVYYLDWEDIQTFVVQVSDTGAIASWTANVQEATGVGFEFAVNYERDGLLLSASGNFNETEYQEDAPNAGVFDGDPVTWVPETTLSASASYAWPVGSYSGVAYVGAVYTDERSDYAPGHVFTSDDITLVNARVGLEAERWSIFLTGENLTDEDGAVSQLAGFTQVGGDPSRSRPLTYGLELNLLF